jgi:hypothetical protein
MKSTTEDNFPCSRGTYFAKGFVDVETSFIYFNKTHFTAYKLLPTNKYEDSDEGIQKSQI